MAHFKRRLQQGRAGKGVDTRDGAKEGAVCHRAGLWRKECRAGAQGPCGKARQVLRARPVSRQLSSLAPLL